MTEAMTATCPNCNTVITAIINPEDIQGDTVNICSGCKVLLVLENNKLRKMTLVEVILQYQYIKKLCQVQATEILIIKLAWVKRALVKMQSEIAALN